MEGSSGTVSCDLEDTCEGDFTCSVLDALRGVPARGEDGAVGLRKELVDDFLRRVGDAADTCRRVIAGEAATLDCRRDGLGEDDALFATEDRLRRSRFCESRVVWSLGSRDATESPALVCSMVFGSLCHTRYGCRETCLHRIGRVSGVCGVNAGGCDCRWSFLHSLRRHDALR